MLLQFDSPMLASPVNTLPTPPLIAIIDDDASMRQALERLMKSLGHPSVSFGSANAFLGSESFKETTCIILDIQMPGLSGLDLQSIVVAMRSPAPIIFITAHRDEAMRDRAMFLGAAGFLEKPFDENVLINLLNKVLPLAHL